MIAVRLFIALCVVTFLNFVQAANIDDRLLSIANKILNTQFPFEVYNTQEHIHSNSQFVANCFIDRAIEDQKTYSRPYNEYTAWCEGVVVAYNTTQKIDNLRANALFLVSLAVLAIPRTRLYAPGFLATSAGLKGLAGSNYPHVDSRFVVEELRSKEQHVNWMRSKRLSELVITKEKNQSDNF